MHGNDSSDRRIRSKEDRPKLGESLDRAFNSWRLDPFVRKSIWHSVAIFKQAPSEIIYRRLLSSHSFSDEIGSDRSGGSVPSVAPANSGTGKGAQAVTHNREEILREWENFISPFLAPSRADSQDQTDY